MSITGIKDIDLLVIKNLLDSEIENVEKCIRLKDETYFWQSLLRNKYKVIIKSNYTTVTSWKRIYLEYSRFFEYFNLTLIIALLKDYYSNKFSLYFLIYMKKKIKYEGFFPLLEKCLTLLKEENILTMEEHLLARIEQLEDIQKEYREIYYNFPHNIKFGKNIFKDFPYTGNNYLLSFLHARIFRRDNIFSYEFTIDNNATLNIHFYCDTIENS